MVNGSLPDDTRVGGVKLFAVHSIACRHDIEGLGWFEGGEYVCGIFGQAHDVDCVDADDGDVDE